MTTGCLRVPHYEMNPIRERGSVAGGDTVQAEITSASYMGSLIARPGLRHSRR